MPPEFGELRAELGRVAAGLAGTLEELREYARGIHPAILADGGLAPALKTLARRSPLPVTLDVQLAGRLPERVEVTAYYVVSEALANAARHAGHPPSTSAPARPATSSGLSSATTGAAERTRHAAPAWRASTTASRPSAGR